MKKKTPTTEEEDRILVSIDGRAVWILESQYEEYEDRMPKPSPERVAYSLDSWQRYLKEQQESNEQPKTEDK